MNRLPLIISGFTETAGRFGGIAVQILQDRLELLALELREAKIHFIQTAFLACMGVGLFLLGLLLLVSAGVYALPPEWRIYGLVGAAAGCLFSGMAAILSLRRRLTRKTSPFEQSLDELKKDTACFSTKN